MKRIGYRVCWIIAMLLGSTSVTSAVFGLRHAVEAVLSGTPVSWHDMFEAPADAVQFFPTIIVLAILTIELLQNGWRESALRRLLLGLDRSTYTDLVYFVIFSTRMMPVLATFFTLGISSTIAAIYRAGPWFRLCADLSVYVAVPAILVLQSFFGYWLHRLLHKSLFWPVHAVHHAAIEFNVVTADRSHPLAATLSAITLPVMPALLGFPGQSIVIALLLSVTYEFYVHAELPTSALLERWVAFGPHGHGIHHGADPSCFNKNFGDLVIWDRLFGTYKVDVSEPLVYGCPDPEGIYQSGRPIRDMIASEAVWLRGLWSWARTHFAAVSRSAA